MNEFFSWIWARLAGERQSQQPACEPSAPEPKINPARDFPLCDRCGFAHAPVEVPAGYCCVCGKRPGRLPYGWCEECTSDALEGSPDAI